MRTNFTQTGKEIIGQAAVFGLITGLVEGGLLLGLHQTTLLTWRLMNRAIWYETLWIAPVVDFLLFILFGAGFALFQWIFPRLPIKKFAWRVFLFLGILDWVMVPFFGRIRLIAILILAVGISVQLITSIAKREASILPKLRRSFPWLAGLTVLLFVAIQGGGWVNEKYKTANLPQANSEKPNVIVIVVDTLRADHLSAYGYQRDTSPFIDNLAREGVLFEHAISASSWTQPSHASMLTGRYTYEHKAENRPLDGTYPTIGEALQKDGYRTGAFSGNTLFFTRRQGFGRGFLHFEDNYQSVPDMFLNSSMTGFLFDFYGLRKVLKYEGVPTRRTAENINQSVLTWIDQDKDKNFLVFINYFDVHDPYTPPEPYRSKYSAEQAPGGLINGFVDRYRPDLTPEQLQSEMDAYDGSISYVDDQIKYLFNELDKRGLMENTIVIITADHGESLGEHNILQHGASLYLQEIHVPLIIWKPGLVPAGKSIDLPVSTTALPGTILSLANESVNPFPGPSLSLLMSDGNPPADWPIPISEVGQYPGAAEQNPSTHGELKSVIDNKMQFITHEKFGDELYDWRNDPEETVSLADDPSFKAVLDALKNHLVKLVGEPIFRNP